MEWRKGVFDSQDAQARFGFKINVVRVWIERDSRIGNTNRAEGAV